MEIMGDLLEFYLKQSPKWGDRETKVESRSEVIKSKHYPKLLKNFHSQILKVRNINEKKKIGTCLSLFRVLYQITID